MYVRWCHAWACMQVRLGKRVLVGTMAQAVHCYSSSAGAKQYSLYLPAPIVCMARMEVPTARLSKCLLLGLANGAWAGACSLVGG